MTKKQLFIDGLKDGFPIFLGYFSVSIAYGMSAVIAGLTITQTIMISLTNLTSAGQFAGTNLITAGASLIELFITMIVINSRYFLMGITISQRVDEKMSIFDRMLVAFGITDEIFAVEASKRPPLKAVYCFGLMVMGITGWVAGTAIGAIASALLPQAITQSLGIALYAMFIAIIVPASKKSKPVAICCLASIALSFLFYYTQGLRDISSGYVIIIITIAVSALMALFYPISEDEYE